MIRKIAGSNKGALNFKQVDIVEIINAHLPAFTRHITEPELTMALDGAEPHADRVDKLLNADGPGRADGGLLAAIETYVNAPGLFALQSAEGVRAKFGGADASTSVDGVLFCAGEGPELHLTLEEEAARDVLLQSLAECAEHGFVRICALPPTVGASVPAVAIARAPKIPWSKVAVIRPRWAENWRAPEDDRIRNAELFDPGLKQIAQALGVSATPDGLALALQTENVLLVVLSACMIDRAGPTSDIAKLVNRLGKTPSREMARGPARLLLMGESEVARKKCKYGKGALGFDGDDPNAQRGRRLGGRVREALAISEARCGDVARACWTRFTRDTPIALEEDAGSRVNYLADYMRLRSGHLKVRPIDIKVHTYFAADRGDFAWFDPTAGFAALAGEAEDSRRIAARGLDDLGPCADIALHRRELADEICALHDVAVNGERRPDRQDAGNVLSYLRAISTGVHWLTARSLRNLLGDVPLAAFPDDDCLQTLKDIGVEYDMRTDPDPDRFHLSLAMKALVQDQWRAVEPSGRARMHHAVARYLWDNQHDKEGLSHELPFVPNRGRHRIHFLAETLRHLVRSVEGIEGIEAAPDRGLAPPPPAPPADEFPARPTAPATPYDVGAVLRFCFERLFVRELQGGLVGRAGRLMTRRYGAFGLSVELLQLLSDGREVGRPHRAMPQDLHATFIREAGLALLDHGWLTEAQRCFRGRATLSADLARRLDAGLDFAMALGIRGRRDHAERRIKRIRRCAGLRLDALERAMDESRRDAAAAARDDAKTLASRMRDLRLVYRRARFREAHACYLRDQPLEAFAIIYRYIKSSHDESDEADLFTDARTRVCEILIDKLPPESVDAAELANEAERMIAVSRPNMETMFVLVSSLRRLARAQTAPQRYQTLEVAMCLAVEARERAASEGRAHEAMGMKILLARLWSDVGSIELAQQYLMAVQDELLQFGGSERTYLALLNELGAVLLKRRDAVGAFVNYLRPCLVRADARDFDREAYRAAQAALMALSMMQEGLVNDPDRHLHYVEKARSEAKAQARRVAADRRDGPLGREAYARDAYAYNAAPDLLDRCGGAATMTEMEDEIRAIVMRRWPHDLDRMRTRVRLANASPMADRG